MPTPYHETDDFRIKKTINIWCKVSPLNQWSRRRRIPVGLDSYSMVDLISCSFVKSFGLEPCIQPSYQHKIPILEGVGETRPLTYGFFHLRITLIDYFGCSFSYIRPFLAIDRDARDS